VRPLPHPIRFWEKVLVPRTPDGAAIETACWLWIGATTSKHYGSYWLRGKARQAHAVAYELCVGPIPDGKVIDHVVARGCRDRRCCNPHHLEAVTDQVNIGRGQSPAGCSTQVLGCPNGHEWTEENTVCVIVKGKIRRRCLTCWEQGINRRS
jgi:hypothetical protein